MRDRVHGRLHEGVAVVVGAELHVVRQEPRGSPRSSRPWARAGTATTTRWPNPSTVSTKTEGIRNHGPWRGLDDVEYATLEYVDWFNRRRLHGEIGMIPPAEFEALHDDQETPAVLTASQ